MASKLNAFSSFFGVKRENILNNQKLNFVAVADLAVLLVVTST